MTRGHGAASADHASASKSIHRKFSGEALWRSEGSSVWSDRVGVLSLPGSLPRSTGESTSSPDIELGLDDLFAAYRRVPTAHPEYMIAAIWDVDAGAPLFYETWGHAFGLRSSVVNFNRVPHLLCAAATRLFAAPVEHFFDDYLTVDLLHGRLVQRGGVERARRRRL